MTDQATVERLYRMAHEIRERTSTADIGEVPMTHGFLLWAPVIKILLDRIDELEKQVKANVKSS